MSAQLKAKPHDLMFPFYVGLCPRCRKIATAISTILLSQQEVQSTLTEWHSGNYIIQHRLISPTIQKCTCESVAEAFPEVFGAE